jgi:hypothetical protein
MLAVLGALLVTGNVLRSVSRRPPTDESACMPWPRMCVARASPGAGDPHAGEIPEAGVSP